jgi:rubrerythrin
VTIVVTNGTGGTAQPVGAVYIPPDRQVPDAGSNTALRETGLDAAFVADLMSACLAHERCGAHLYRSVAGRTGDAELRSQYEHFGEETRQHVEKLEQLVVAAGGDPQYVSAAARATEKAGAGLLESTYLLSGSVDPMTAELVMLEAVMLAEAKDHGNWELLAQLAAAMADGDLRRNMETVASEVLAQEEDHYTWARDTRAQLLLSLAGAATAVGESSPSEVSADMAERSRDELYAEAQALGIPGRSRMTKEELRAALDEQKGQSS